MCSFSFILTYLPVDQTILSTSESLAAETAANEQSHLSIVLKLETKHLEERWDEQGRVHITEAGEAPPKNDADWADYVLTHTRHFNRFSGQYTHSGIEIKSKPLKALLKHAIRNYPGVTFATDEVTLIMPAHPLFNTRDELWKIVKEEKLGSEDGRAHLKYLLEWYEEEERQLITQYDDLVAQGLTTYAL